MAVQILITLTESGVDNGTFYDLFSDVDGFTIAYAGSIPLASLLAGYLSDAPDGTTVVRVCSKQTTCTNCIDITVNYTTTTTSTTTLAP